MITAGIDIGSLTGKVVIQEDGVVLAWHIIPTGYDSENTARKLMSCILEKSGLSHTQIKRTVSTGYGRVIVPFADRNISEITCHAKGAFWMNQKVRTILDMGGQDCKAIRCDANGDVVDFAMNDKCAAGAGRYLEMIADLVGMPIDKIGECSIRPVNGPALISSVCAVFACTEILRFLRRGVHLNDVMAGAHDALTTRVYGILKKVGLENEMMFTGGIAKNTGMVDRLKRKTGLDIKIGFEPQIAGALGAAMLARECL